MAFTELLVSAGVQARPEQEQILFLSPACLNLETPV